MLVDVHAHLCDSKYGGEIDSLVKAYEDKLGFYSCTVPTFMQYVLTELIDNGDFERHINRVRRRMRKKLST